MWPMLAGIGSLLGGSEIGSFHGLNYVTRWYYDHGDAGTTSSADIKQSAFQMRDFVAPISERTPVAVLIGPLTASSGEATAIAFRGRPNTKFFGEHSCGLSTANETVPLPDGAKLMLTVSLEADRKGNIYEN